MTADIELRPEPVSVPAARRFVHDFIEYRSLRCDADLAALLTSELVTNALLHARGTIQVYARPAGTGLRVEVHDTSPSMPRRLEPSADRATGRGLAIVEHVADDWGVYALEGATDMRKVVWFALTG